jgi:putative membrane protein
MNKRLFAAAPAMAAVLLAAACSSDGKPYAFESKRHPTAAEHMSGASPGEPSVVPPSSAPAASSAPTAAKPTIVAPGPITVPQPVARLGPTDQVFTQQQVSSCALEIELARVAFVRAQTPEVREYARHMLTEHRQQVIELDDFALQRGFLITWDIEQAGINTIELLRTIDTASFDRAYMNEMVEKHEKAAANLQIYSANSHEAASLAAKALSTAQRHLEEARALQARL